MELLQLYYFKVLAEREHLTRTAESLMIAAPSLSATISRLENELGVKLFDRVGRNIRLNENGRILQRYVNEIFDALQNAKTELKDAGVRRDNCFTVASTAESLWTRAIHKFLETYPDILVQHTAIKLDDLNQHMTSSKYDFIVTALRDLDCGEWDYEVLYHDWPVLVFNSSHRFHGRKTLDLLEALSLRSPRAIPPAAGLTRSVPPPALSPTWSSSAITSSAPKCSGPIMGSASPLCWESPATYSARLNMPSCHSPLSPGPRSLPGTKGASSPSRPVNSALS